MKEINKSADTKRNPYEDIIDLPHHVSPTRAHMSLYDRAAQFAPFAALTGHSDAIKRTQNEFEVENRLETEEIDDI